MPDFIKPADEAELRVMVRNMYKNGGIDAVLRCLGEIFQSVDIICKTVKEIDDEEKNKKQE